ncbi:ScbA/BarX family gamma-butyrolactone biosynthesis protein [Nocardia carnea]|uniref:ScbA/BarX family gamma-butyrolactone biosynthesis protein n=1 Tax=Nocardia carnea TaxID=37328 RepID=UPI00245886FD|nr:ScbA/BarX family gamma-butyrolactone biosynthesis protein [Nocardia carnea]
MTETPTRAPTLAFDQAVPRALAHRRAVAEVFVTDTAVAGDGDYLAAVQIPRAHSLWSDRMLPCHDPLSVVEAVRQSLLVIGQRYLRVPADAPASLQRMGFAVEDLSALRDDERTPLEGVVRIRSAQDPATSGYYQNVSFEAQVVIAGVPAMTLAGGGIAFPRDAYDELRTLQQRSAAATSAPPPEPIDPESVGRRDPRNIVLGTAGDRLVVRVDQRHPSFFDHPYDHVPGPLLLEAFRQAALLTGTRSGLLADPFAAVTGLRAEFREFAELDGALTCTAEPEPDSEPGFVIVRATLHQYGKQVATGTVELTARPADHETTGYR